MDYNEYAQGMGLARWKGGEKRWKGCDSLNHQQAPRSRHGGQTAFRSYWANFPDSHRFDGFHTLQDGSRMAVRERTS